MKGGVERRQALETLTIQRRLRALELVEQRELRSLENALLKERRIEDRERSGRQPPPVEPSRDPHTDVFNKAAKKPIDLTAEFERATNRGEGEGEASGEVGAKPGPGNRGHRSSGGSGRRIGRRRLNARLRRGALTTIAIMMDHPATIRCRAGVGTGISTETGDWHFFHPFFLNCPYNWPKG